MSVFTSQVVICGSGFEIFWLIYNLKMHIINCNILDANRSYLIISFLYPVTKKAVVFSQVQNFFGTKLSSLCFGGKKNLIK